MTLIAGTLFSFIASLFLSFGQNIPPFKISEDMAISKSYEKRMQIPQNDQLEFIYYTDRARKPIQKINDPELLGFRCGDGIIRTVQGAYVLESAKTALGEKRRIQNQDFIEFMRSKEPKLPPGKRILSARVCELKDNTILLFYTTGVYNSKDADTQTPRLVVLNSSNNQAFIQIISIDLLRTNNIFEIRKSAEHTRCDRPFQITRDRALYILCEEKQDFVSSYFVYRLDLKNGSLAILEKCINKFQKGIETFCN